MDFRTKLKAGKKAHDTEFKNVIEQWKHLVKGKKSTKEIPYDSNANTEWHEAMRSVETEWWNNIFYNMLVNRTGNGGNDLEMRMSIMLRRRIQKLCNDEVRDFHFLTYFLNVLIYNCIVRSIRNHHNWRNICSVSGYTTMIHIYSWDLSNLRLCIRILRLLLFMTLLVTMKSRELKMVQEVI